MTNLKLTKILVLETWKSHQRQAKSPTTNKSVLKSKFFPKKNKRSEVFSILTRINKNDGHKNITKIKNDHTSYEKSKHHR